MFPTYERYLRHKVLSFPSGNVCSLSTHPPCILRVTRSVPIITIHTTFSPNEWMVLWSISLCFFSRCLIGFERDWDKLSHLQHLCIVANSDLTSVESVLTWWLKGQLLLNPICISALLTTHKPNAVPMDSENTFSMSRFLHLLKTFIVKTTLN